MDRKYMETEFEVFEVLASQTVNGLLNISGKFIGKYCNDEVIEKLVAFGHCVGGPYLPTLISDIVQSGFDLAKLEKIVERSRAKIYGTADIFTKERLAEAITACGEAIALFHELRSRQSEVDSDTFFKLIQSGSEFIEPARSYPTLKPLLDDTAYVREQKRLLAMTKATDFADPLSAAILAEAMIGHLRSFGPNPMDELIEVLKPSLFKTFWDVTLTTDSIPLYTDLIHQQANHALSTGKITQREYETRLCVVALGHALILGQSPRTFSLAYSALVDGTRSLFAA